MLRITGTQVAISRSIWWLPCLLGALATAHAIGAGQVETTAAIAVAQQADAASTRYRVVNLGTGQVSQLPAINAKGQVAFTLNNGSGERAFFYDGTAVKDIGTLGLTPTSAVALNNLGQVVGSSTYNTFGSRHAFIWSRSTGMVDLGSLGGAPASAAAAINNFGRVAGTSQFLGPITESSHAIRWSFADGMEDLGTLLNGGAVATAINDAGLIAGFVNVNSGFRGFAWTRSTGMVDIGSLGGPDTFPVAVGAKGEVAGYSTINASGLLHAFLWTRCCGMRDLGTAGGTESFVLAMSPNAHAAGAINLANGFQHAMSWTQAGGMLDLGTLGGPGSRALSVNNKGQVVGLADVKPAHSHAFVWTRARGMVDLNKRLHHAPKGLVLDAGFAISDNGSIVASSNAGLVLLKPGRGHKDGASVGPIAGASLVQAGAPFDAAASFADEDTAATHSVSWSWGDGSGDQAGNMSESQGAGSASATHVYNAPGIYSVTANVVDRAGKRATVSRDVVVVDASGGFVGGSGWFTSPQGANRAAPLQAGRAAFSFVSSKARNGRAELRFNVGGLSFRSENFSPVAAQGAPVQFHGSGTINGAGDYKFSLVATAGAAVGEGEPGRFSLRIWHIDPVTKAEVVDYDNQGAGSGAAGGPIVEGRIAVQ